MNGDWNALCVEEFDRNYSGSLVEIDRKRSGWTSCGIEIELRSGVECEGLDSIDDSLEGIGLKIGNARAKKKGNMFPKNCENSGC